MIVLIVFLLIVLVVVITCCSYSVKATWEYAEQLEERIKRIERKI